MHKSKIFTSASLFALMLVIAGCAGIPADRNILPQQDMARAQLTADIKLAHDGWPDRQWWAQYGDLQLNGLIEQALANSPTLEVAAARIGSARAVLAFNGADKGPNVNFNAAESRQRYSANGLFPAPIGGSYFNESTLQVQARYDFDWWGKHRAQIAAALGEVNARRADYAQAEQVLAAAITQSYFNLQSSWERLANMHKSVATQSELVADKVKRIAHGVAAIDEQRMAETELSYLNRQVAQLDAQIAAEREALRALLGADSNALADLKQQRIADIPHTLPSRLGMELLARRPDLQAARWRVEASLSRIEVAQAAFYPDINLTGSIGLDALSLNNLFSAGSRTLFIGPTLSLPLFDSKRLEALLGTARSERNEMIADYNQTIFNVVRDVAQQGAALQGIESQMKHQAGAMQASNELLRTAQAKFKQGLAERGTVLAAELALSKQRDAELQLENQQLIAEVSLIKALGGGYRTDPTGTDAALTQLSK
ncbi:MAG TPA: efflux transporter outer membrane subunit [Burkholderiaceae bacterium]|nr:efflux transporter outer membrane subunit [Burkholderiaceae bacterium]